MKVLCIKFHQNCTVNEEIKKKMKTYKMPSQKKSGLFPPPPPLFGGGGGSEISREKIKTFKMPPQNKSIYEVSSKSGKRKGFKNRGKIKERNHPTNSQMWRNLVTCTRKWLSLGLCNFFPKRNFDTGFLISSVGIPEISAHTKFHQNRTINEEFDLFEGAG